MKTLLLIVTAALFLAGCAALDPLASFRPLFPRLDESGLSTQARAALAEAKHDFQETREQRPPRVRPGPLVVLRHVVMSPLGRPNFGEGAPASLQGGGQRWIVIAGIAVRGPGA